MNLDNSQRLSCGDVLTAGSWNAVVALPSGRIVGDIRYPQLQHLEGDSERH
ncbi:MAG: hypothetical protein ACJA07_001469 [Rhodococcus sp. (in: high G+C Gram-positive bacteria)]|jgi:hypothetical protein